MSNLTMPGEALATEEEVIPSEGTFVEEGDIRAAVTGSPVRSDSKISVKSTGRSTRLFTGGMAVLGLVTDDLRSVVFVRISDLNTGDATYVALKSGKVVNPKAGMGRGRPRRDEAEEARPLKVGDTILARIIAEDKDVYTLSVNMPEFGVVYAECELCGAPFDHDRENRALVCRACDRTVRKKLSSLYGDVNGIDMALKKYANVVR